MGRGRPSINYPPSNVCEGIKIEVGIGSKKYSTEMAKLLLEKGQLGKSTTSAIAQMEIHHGTGFHLVVRSEECRAYHTDIDEKTGFHELVDVSPSGRPCQPCSRYESQRLRPKILPALLRKAQKTEKEVSARTMRREQARTREEKLERVAQALETFAISDVQKKL